MTENIVVIAASGRPIDNVLRNVAGDFGWGVLAVHDIADLRESGIQAAAVLFHSDAFAAHSWAGALAQVKIALPGALPIACHGFSEQIDWPTLSDAGLFHSLWLPLRESEVRRTLGFVWEARQRLAKASRARRVPLQRVAHVLEPPGIPAAPATATALAAA